MDWKRYLGLALSAAALALVVWGLFFAPPAVKWPFPLKVGIVNEAAAPR